MSKKVILATLPLNPLAMEMLKGHAEVRVASATDGATIAREVGGVHGIIVRLGDVTAEAINAADELQVIGKNGVGLDSIDVAAATARGIPVLYTPDANGMSVAEHVVGAAISLARRYPIMDQETRKGNWSVREQPIHELSGRTFGFVGLGRIGLLAARKCRGAFDCPVLAYDPYADPARAAEVGATMVGSLEELLSRSDVVSLHVALTPDTRRLIGRKELAAMKPTAYLVNASRGPVVDEAALVEALRQGTIAGAALDVFEEEPIRADNPLCALPNVVLTPHTAGVTQEANERVTRTLIADMLAVMRGSEPRFVANPEVVHLPPRCS